MAYNTFTWSPDIGAQRRMKPHVYQIKLGDGYENRIADGINFMLPSWTVKFTGSEAIVSQILNFLEGQQALTPFTWTDPLNNTGTYICRDWNSSQIGFGVYQLNAVFEGIQG